MFPQEAPNSTNIDEVIKKAADNDGELTDINLNNIKYISDEKWAKLFDSLKVGFGQNCHRFTPGKHERGERVGSQLQPDGPSVQATV